MNAAIKEASKASKALATAPAEITNRNAIADRDHAIAIGERIKRLREDRQITQLALARLCDKTRSAIAQWEAGQTSPSMATLVQLGRVLNSTPEYLAFGIEKGVRTVTVLPERVGLTPIELVEFEAADEFRKIGTYGLNDEQVKEIGAADTSKLKAVKVSAAGQIDAYLVGDILVVDTGITKPAGAGVYLWWDGFSASLAHLSIAPSETGEPAVRLRSGADVFVIAAEKVRIIGRVVKRTTNP